jgi:23S rRNA pseudouridine2605 synthase
VISVGRLDLNSEGLLLLTNDGAIARLLELPSTGWVRRYRVRAFGDIDEDRLAALDKGITIDGMRYAGIEAEIDRRQGGNLWLTMGLREGKNREIRRVLEALGLKVNRLIRLSYGPFHLGQLPKGAVEEIPRKILRDQLGAKIPALAEKTPRRARSA